MQLQFVYGNPIKKKKKLKTKKESKAVAKKRRKKVTKSSKVKTKKVVRKAKGRKKVRRKAKAKKVAKKVSAKKKQAKVSKSGAKRIVARRKKKKKKNPENVNVVARKVVGKDKKGKNKYAKVKSIRVGTRATLGEVYQDLSLGHLAKERYGRLTAKKKKSKYGKKIKSMAEKKLAKAKKAKAKRSLITTQKAGLRADLKSRRFHPVTKTKTYKRNPYGGTMNKIESLLGSSMKEVGGLAAGGMLYGAVNSAAARFAKPIHTQLAKIPVVGTALPTLLIGALANYLGERQNIDALKVVGKGLVGASVVGMGVNASQMVPGLKPAALSGMGYEEMYGLPEGMGDDADFGSDGADFGGIDYTMEGIDYTMEGQMGYDDADFGGVDYTEEMDGLPEGMGEGQMG